ncbi:MAG TPA: GAF domain-containing protein [Gaiellales bacterium]|jgi:GAF domain-containing protein
MAEADARLRDAVAAGVLADDATHRALLGSIVQVARAIFGARAASVLLLDEETNELVFEAVVGEGEDTLVGRRFPAGTGIAGWVLNTRQPLVLSDVAADPRFSTDTAKSTGFVPSGIMAVPLLHGEEVLGVLEVLDRPANARFRIEEVDLLGLFGIQAAAALALLRRARLAAAALSGGGGDLRALAQIAGRLAERGDDDTVAAFLRSLDALLERSAPS